MAGPDHLAHLRSDTTAFAATIEDGTLGLGVPGCPGWDLRQLAGHLGWVHRWAAAAVRTAAAPDPGAIEAPPAGSGGAGGVGVDRRARARGRARRRGSRRADLAPLPGSDGRGGVAPPPGPGDLGAPVGRRVGRGSAGADRPGARRGRRGGVLRGHAPASVRARRRGAPCPRRVAPGRVDRRTRVLVGPGRVGRGAHPPDRPGRSGRDPPGPGRGPAARAATPRRGPETLSSEGDPTLVAAWLALGGN